MTNNLGFMQKKALQIRRCILQTALWGGKGHIPPAFSWTEIAVALFYGGILSVRPTEPKWSDRDRFILSKGHGCLTLYAVLSDLGFFSSEELKKFAGNGSLLAGHPDNEMPGVETCTGSLGHGLGVGAGMALSAKLAGQKWRTFVVLGDGECHEGSVWEAAMFAGHQKLHNLIVIVDRNKLGATDFTENYASLDPLDKRFTSFGWDVAGVDGHDIPGLINILNEARNRNAGKPFCIVANTIKGKGVDFMENSKLWHHLMPKGKQIEEAWEQLGGAP